MGPKPAEAAAICTWRGSGLGVASNRGVRRRALFMEDGVEVLLMESGGVCCGCSVGCWRCLG